ncbi:hypothetical protein TNCT_103681 [Trichonephila clavata]|uniref:Uncharacterized protein n=1 Tax=Trichonephila clavata TaxID=2740835 RepID=A0A8X6FQT4_TRICU|nr:hypothetical protein TNCT_103681 [Trichonephila clavata]
MRSQIHPSTIFRQPTPAANQMDYSFPRSKIDGRDLNRKLPPRVETCGRSDVTRADASQWMALRIFSADMLPDDS